MSYEPVNHGEHRHRSSQERLHGFDMVETDKSPSTKPQPGNRFSAERLHTLISIAAGTVMMLFGYEQGVFGGIIIGQEFKGYFDQPSPAMTGFVTSVYDLGCFAGALLTLVVGEKLGRKRTLIVFTVIMTTGILMQTASQSMQDLIWGRFIAGIGNGGNTATAPVWHVETSKSEAKGKAVVKEMTVNVLGFVISNVFTLAFSHMASEAQWRFPLGIQLIFCVTILVMIPLLPESPRWLLARRRDSEAKTVLAQLFDHDIEDEFRDLRDSVRQEMAARASWLQIFKGGTPTRRLLLGMLLQVCQQLAGINLLCYFLPLVLHESVGLPEDPSRILATAIAVVYTFATYGSMFLIDRLGRRRLLMWLAGAMSIAFVGIAISTEIGSAGGSHLITGIVATVFMTLYFVAFGLGWVAVPWLYPAEINGLSMRTKGAALATACDWIFNWLVVQSTPPGIAYLKWGIYIIYAVFNAAFIPIIYYFVVETAGKSLEQIDEWFVQHPGWRVDKVYSAEVSQVKRASFDSGDDAGAEESQGLVKGTTHAARYEQSYDRDAHSLDETDFVIAGESDEEDGDLGYSNFKK